MCAFPSLVFQYRPTPACFEEGWIKTRTESAAERAECWEELPFQIHSQCLQASWGFAMRLGAAGRSFGVLQPLCGGRIALPIPAAAELGV